MKKATMSMLDSSRDFTRLQSNWSFRKILTLGVFKINVCVFLWPKTLFARRWKAQKHRKFYIIKNTPTSTEAG